MVLNTIDFQDERLFLILIIFLTLLLFILVLGILFNSYYLSQPFSFVFEYIIDFFYRFGKSLSDIVNTSGDVVTSTGKFGFTLSNNIIHDIGNMVKGQPTPNIDNGNDIKVDISVKNTPA